MAPPTALLQALEDALAPEAVVLAILYGSAARGTMHAKSDLDVAVVFEPSDTSLKNELALESRLTTACKRDVQLVRLDTANDLLRWQIAKDGVLIKGNRRDFLRFVVKAARDHADMAPLLESAGRTFRQRLMEAG